MEAEIDGADQGIHSVKLAYNRWLLINSKDTVFVLGHYTSFALLGPGNVVFKDVQVDFRELEDWTKSSTESP